MANVMVEVRGDQRRRPGMPGARGLGQRLPADGRPLRTAVDEWLRDGGWELGARGAGRTRLRDRGKLGAAELEAHNVCPSADSN
jgi:hypothetical protein